MLVLSLVPIPLSALINSTTVLVAALFLWSAWLAGKRPRRRAVRPLPIPQ